MYIIVPIVAAILFGMYLRRRSEDSVRAMTLFCFSIAAVLSVYPRADVWHILYLGFVFALCLIFRPGSVLTSRVLRNAVLGTLSLCLIGGFAEIIWAGIVRIERLDYHYLRLPHFEYAMASGRISSR
jgi:asparagine N-glycosylation enzyme membrane subunit Stt3